MPKGEKPMDLPAGHERDEAKREVADELQEEIETRQARDGIEPIDAAKMARRDNEILGQLDEAGFVHIENREDGKNYALLTVADGYPENAQANIRQMHAKAKFHGYVPVQGMDNPVAKNLIGQGRTSGTSLRGVADTALFEQTDEARRKMEDADRRKMNNQMAVEEQSVVYASERLGRAGMANTMHTLNDADPRVARGAGPLQSETFSYQPNRTNFTEGDLRRGSMPGPDGRTLQPGFDARRFR